MAPAGERHLIAPGKASRRLRGAVLPVLTALLWTSSLAAPTYAEEPSRPADAEAGERRFSWARTVARDGRYLFTRPAHLDRGGWAKAAAVGTATL